MGGTTLADSYRYCARQARRAASSFYWSFWVLRPAQRRAMCALYAFARHTDDLGDSDGPLVERAAALAAWRDELERALSGQPTVDPLLPALADSVTRYDIPARYLFAVIDGVDHDLQTVRFETFDELRGYCRQVASAVGLACLRIWGCHSDGAEGPADACGLAFQLTNILRDLAEDAARDRIYLPLEDLHQFNYSVDDLRRGVRNESLRELLRFEIERAESLYQQGHATRDYLSAEGRRSFDLMFGVYHELLHAVRRAGERVLDHRVRLSCWEKCAVVARWCRARGGRRRTVIGTAYPTAKTTAVR